MATKTSPKLPPFMMVDTDKVMAAQQRNLDAFASAAQIVADGFKAIAQRQSEIMQSSVDELVSAGQGAFAGKPADFQPADQMVKAKTAYEAAVGNAKELGEIAIKAQTEAVDVLTKCVMANIDDLKTAAKAA